MLPCAGSDVNAKGYKVPRGVGVIQGDGINYHTIQDMLAAVMEAGFSVEVSSAAAIARAAIGCWRGSAMLPCTRVCRPLSELPNWEGPLVSSLLLAVNLTTVGCSPWRSVSCPSDARLACCAR